MKLFNGRSKFDTFMDVLILFYEFKSLKVSSLISKASLSNQSQREIVDQLLISGIIGVSNNNFLFLIESYEQKLLPIIIAYKKSRDLFNEVYKNETI